MGGAFYNIGTYLHPGEGSPAFYARMATLIVCRQGFELVRVRVRVRARGYKPKL